MLSHGGFSLLLSERKNYQYSTEGQKFHLNLAPVLVIISGNSLVFCRNYYQYWFLPVLRPRRVSTSSGKNQSPTSLLPWLQTSKADIDVTCACLGGTPLVEIPVSVGRSESVFADSRLLLKFQAEVKF